MMTRWIIPAAIGAVVLMAVGGASAYPSTPDEKPGGMAAIVDTVRATGAPSPWETYLSAVGRRESRFNTDALNDSGVDRAGALRAYDRQRDRGYLAGTNRDEWGYTGGWFGLMPANVIVGAYGGTDLESMSPTAIFDPDIATLLALHYAYRLSRWSNYDGTWLGLRVGWKNPGAMDDPAVRAAVAKRFAADLAAIGAPESFMHQRVPGWDWYPGAVNLYYQMAGVA